MIAVHQLDSLRAIVRRYDSACKALEKGQAAAARWDVLRSLYGVRDAAADDLIEAVRDLCSEAREQEAREQAVERPHDRP